TYNGRACASVSTPPTPVTPRRSDLFVEEHRVAPPTVGLEGEVRHLAHAHPAHRAVESLGAPPLAGGEQQQRDPLGTSVLLGRRHEGAGDAAATPASVHDQLADVRPVRLTRCP